jgi:hypothetical protein
MRSKDITAAPSRVLLDVEDWLTREVDAGRLQPELAPEQLARIAAALRAAVRTKAAA